VGTKDVGIGGFVAPGYKRVADVFERNFTERGEVGAAFAAMRDGELVVDLWGGWADEAARRPWEEDTLQLVFSGTKGLVATCLLMLIDRGQLALDDPVAKHWPEFAARGKEHVTVADIASHRSRLPAIRRHVTERELADDVLLARLLADQPQETDPRAELAYHALTYGWLCGELIRRATGRSVGTFFAEEVAAPLGLELWIGLPESEEPRVATLVYGPRWGANAPGDEQLAADDLLASIWNNPRVYPRERIIWNERSLHAAEVPGANAIGTARSIARLYGCLARGGELDGVRLMAPETIALGRRELSRFEDLFNTHPMAFGVGFQLQTELMAYGPTSESFGHGGAGGSIHAAWPNERVGLSYAMNQLRDDIPDPRSRALLSALHECVAGARDAAPAGTAGA
jgi:CubicO group peptidase (beta-lactamase class C family)